MRTVKEFKDAGLVFVDGDKYKDKLIPIAHKWHDYVNHGSDDWNDDKIEGFAWRTNTGEKPSFSGVVEIRSSLGCSSGRTSSIIWNELVKDWRPVISKESKMEGKTRRFHSYQKPVDWDEGGYLSFYPNPNATTQDGAKVEWQLTGEDAPEKPIYTKEMHEAGELPPVGSKFMLAKKVDCQRIDAFQGSECTVIGHCKDLDGDDVITFSEPSRGYACMLHIPEFIKPIDTRTDEEKLIDEALTLIKGRQCDTNHHACLPEQTVELMIKAGYRKP